MRSYIKRLFPFLFFLVIANISNAQKIDRAINAYKDAKYDKALELFTEFLEKNPNDIAAVLGKALTHLSRYQNLNIEPSVESIKETIIQLKNIYTPYNRLTTDDKAFIKEAFAIYSVYDIDKVLSDASKLLWIRYTSKSDNITEIENYNKFYNYCKDLDSQVLNLLSELNYKKALSINNLNGYRDYIEKFPSSVYKNDALKKIERLEYQDAISNNTIEALSGFLKKFPKSSLRDSIEINLSELYHNIIALNTKNKKYLTDIANDLKFLSSTTIRNKLIDTCNLLIFDIDKNEILNSKNLNEINTFIEVYKKNKNYIINDVINYRNQLWRDELKRNSNFNIYDISLFIKSTKISQNEIEDMLSSINENVSLRIKKGINEVLKEKIRADTYIESPNQLNSLINLFQDLVKIKVAIDNKNIYEALLNNDQTEEEDILKGIFKNTNIYDVVDISSIYFKSFGDDNRLLEVLSKNLSSVINSTIYEYDGMSYQKIPQIKTSFPIFNAIKERYKIISFSIPQVKSINNNGYVVQLYGYSQGNQACCPNFTLDILYSKNDQNFTPVTAISIDSFYGTVENSKNLNQYSLIDKMRLIGEE